MGRQKSRNGADIKAGTGVIKAGMGRQKNRNGADIKAGTGKHKSRNGAVNKV